MRNLVGWLAVLVFLWGSPVAQSQKPPPPSQPPTAPSRDTRNPSPARPPQRQPALLFLSGLVQYEDGTPISNPVLVELRCNGNTRSQVWSSTGGQFSFQLGGSRQLEAFDVSVGGGFGRPGAGANLGSTGFGLDPFADRDRTRPVNLSGCEIRLAQGGYQSRPIRLGLRSSLDSPDVGVLIVQRREGVEGNLVSLKTLAAPKKARKALQKATRLLSRKEPQIEKARQQLKRAVEIFPEFSAAWHLLGKVRAATEEWEGAREAFQLAVQNDPLFIPPYLALGQIELHEQEWPAAVAAFDRALELNPHDVQARFSLGLAHFHQNHLDAALNAFQAVMKSTEAAQYPGLHYALGLVFALQGKVPEAADQLQQHLEMFPEGKVAEKIHLQLAEWRRLGLIQP